MSERAAGPTRRGVPDLEDSLAARTDVVDLRSDAYSAPTEEMWDAMKLGAEVSRRRGADRSVGELEALGAELLGKEDALFLPTCSMANLLAAMTLGERGTKVVVGAASHIACLEDWGIAYICGLFTQTFEDHRGTPSPEAVERAMAEYQAYGAPRTSLLCLENTHNNAGGVAVTPEDTHAVVAVARRHGAAVHLDGARIFNAAVALQLPPSRLTTEADTVSVSLNKGLAAPYGALLAGTIQTISQVRSNQRRIGAASIHKAGVLAAAGIVALRHVNDYLVDDHEQASQLAKGLASVPGIRVELELVQSNIVLADLEETGVSAAEFVERLSQRGVLAQPRSTRYRVRFVTHRLIRGPEVARAVDAARVAVSQ